MQIITGKYRGRKLDAVDAETTRPTLARVKESIFNLIQDRISDSVVLDLFAGSGAFGLECVSRSASKVYLVDKEKKSISTITKNSRNMTEDFEIINSDYVNALDSFANKKIKFDLVYLDPPYDSDFAIKSLRILEDKKLLNNGACIVVEHKYLNDLQNLSKCYIMEKSRKYGIAFVDVLKFVN